MGMLWIVLLTVAYVVLILGFTTIVKKYHALKKENDRLKDVIMNLESETTTEEKKLHEYQSIIDKIKNRYKDNEKIEGK